MSRHVYADYAPPRSWEQFEELCADVFQSAWRDPALVRNGRAGQRQNGVDIVGRNGAVYPIGLQCKKRSKWPVSRLTTKEIDAEVNEAMKFTPTLKAFYILTTAPDDATLLKHVRKISEMHAKSGLFEVALLGWGEILRRATCDRDVADKHFGPSGGGAPRSPLLATWMMSDGKLEKTGAELELSVNELVLDLHDWPTGHIVVRQRESDALLDKLRMFEGKALDTDKRKKRIALRNRLRILTDTERQAADAIMLMLTDPDLSGWLKVFPDDLPLTIESYINNELRPKLPQPQSGRGNGAGALYLRMSPPGYSGSDRRCSATLSHADMASISAIMKERVKMFGNPATNTVGELPDEVRARVAMPRIIRGIYEFVNEDRLTWEQVRQMRAFDIHLWSAEVA